MTSSSLLSVELSNGSRETTSRSTIWTLPTFSVRAAMASKCGRVIDAIAQAEPAIRTAGARMAILCRLIKRRASRIPVSPPWVGARASIISIPPQRTPGLSAHPETRGPVAPAHQPKDYRLHRPSRYDWSLALCSWCGGDGSIPRSRSFAFVRDDLVEFPCREEITRSDRRIIASQALIFLWSLSIRAMHVKHN